MTRKNILVKNLNWTPTLAYVVGLITTDGCLSNNGRHIIMRSSDIEQLMTFKKCLKLSNKIGRSEYKGVVSYRVQFGDVIFYHWLMSLGLTPNKSKTLEKIKVPNKFFIDFLRGHLDGDGSITTYTDYYNTKTSPKYIYKRLFVRFISASKSHVEWLHKKIKLNTGILGRIHVYKSKIPNRADMYTIKFMKKDSINLLKQIYYKKDIPSLSRKRLIAEKFI